MVHPFDWVYTITNAYSAAQMSDERARKAYAYLKERDDKTVSVADLAAATGWTPSTVKTYIGKHWRPWLRRLSTGEYRVQQFGSVSLSLFLARQSQVKAPPGVPPSLLERIELALRTKESQEFEFKESLPENRSKLAQEFAAFATSNDGLVLIGVSDGGTVVGVPAAESDDEQARIREVLEASADKVRPPLAIATTFVERNGQWIAAVEVAKGPEPVYYSDGKPYVRAGTRSRPAEPGEVKRFIADAADRDHRDLISLFDGLRQDILKGMSDRNRAPSE